MDVNVVTTENLLSGDIECLYEDEKVISISNILTLTDLVVELGLFKSKSQARKANRVGPLPRGWNVLKGNKKTFIYLWNPV